MFGDDFEERVANLDRITRDPAVQGGLPCIRGTRFPVWSVLDWLAAGRSAEELLSDFPFLEPEDVRQALKWTGRNGGTAERLRTDVVVPPDRGAAPSAPADDAPIVAARA
ncbi:MAG: DUF433 domain-containing protein [Chloroflexi bacterium]|nr:DUF433 domain-containing protein [Chloroflexota bacterium]